LAGSHLGAKLRNSQPGNLFWLMGVTGAYLDDLAGDELPIGSFRSTKPRRPRASANARFSLSTSSGLNLPSFNTRLIGIPAPRPSATLPYDVCSWVVITWFTAHGLDWNPVVPPERHVKGARPVSNRVGLSLCRSAVFPPWNRWPGIRILGLEVLT
jgi:hypothetical protein